MTIQNTTFDSTYEKRISTILINNNQQHLLRKEWEPGSRWFYRIVEWIISQTQEFEQAPITYKKFLLDTIVLAYHSVKNFHRGQNRDSGERYFDHLQETALITLLELPNPSIKKILIWLYHDAIEDALHPETKIKVVHAILANCWDISKDVLDSVISISKKDLRKYVSDWEFEWITRVWIEMELVSSNTLKLEIDWINPYYKNPEDKFIDDIVQVYWDENWNDYIKLLKDRRNADFFWHMIELDSDTLDVKLADRIHNLRTLLSTQNQEKISRKIKETEVYFTTIAIYKNPTAYMLISKEIENIKSELYNA